MPEHAASPTQHVGYAQVDQVPPGPVGTFCFPLVRLFHCHFSPLQWPEGCYKNIGIKVLTKFTQQELKWQWRKPVIIEHWNICNEKSFPPDRMALDIVTALQGSTCAIIQTQSCVFMPDESTNVSSLLNHKQTKWMLWMIQPQSRGLNKSMIRIIWLLTEKVVTDLRIHCLNLYFLLYVPVLLLWHLLPMQSPPC